MSKTLVISALVAVVGVVAVPAVVSAQPVGPVDVPLPSCSVGVIPDRTPPVGYYCDPDSFPKLP